MTILIPAYEPDEKMLHLIEDLKLKTNYKIVIVDDGSGFRYNSIFEKAKNLGCELLSYPLNKGKGHALKTGFQYILKTDEKEGVTCADCDGQHTAPDIIKVAEKIKFNKRAIVLGTRKFIGKVPFRSLFGNILTKILFFLSTGIKLKDTQTGLRGLSVNLLSFLCSVKGNRFEYELGTLLEAGKEGFSIVEEPIQTIYLEQNKSSHFHPFKDSVRIYLPLIKFSLSSLFAALVDFFFLLMFHYLTENLLFSLATARLISSVINFLANKKLVFDKGKGNKMIPSAAKYFTLVLFILFLNYGLMFLLYTTLMLPLIPAKIFTELLLFTVSYKIQKCVIFSGFKINEIRL